MLIYLLPGLGADERLFSALTFPPGYTLVHVHFPVPAPNDTMASYAARIAEQIDQSEKFILVGVSLGGMICCELAAITKPEKVIIISSAQCRREIPKLYQLQAYIGLNRVVPGWLIKYSAIGMQGIFEPDSWNDRKFFRDMIRRKPSVYYKRTVNMIINWARPSTSGPVVHIHGSGDRTLPMKLVNPHHVIEKGSHMMVYTRAKEMSEVLRKILGE